MGKNLIIILLSLVICLSTAFSQDLNSNSKESLAPLNPEFVKWLEAKKAGKLEIQVTEEGKALGYIPPPIKFPKKEISLYKLFTPAQLVALPSTFDLRTIGGVTPVKDQGACGSCWTFATMASLESYLKYKKTQTWDFSEQDLNQYHGFSIPECEGGNAVMSAAYLTRWSGPVKEADVPYPYAQATPGVPVVKHIQNIWFLPNTTVDTIKNAVYNYGALYIAFRWDSNYYNSTYKSFYNPTGGSANHAVAIVGWNDNFPKQNFKTQPPGNGAFIVKNSWGPDWGDNGYFYLSYYDTTLDEPVSFYNAEPANNYKRIYEYDPLGITNALGAGSNTGWMANIFIASPNADLIKAVGFYAQSPGTQYEIYIYDNLTNKSNPQSGTLKYTKTGTANKMGYVTIKLGSGVKVTPYQRFSVVVKLTTPGWNFPIPIEDTQWGYSDAASCGLNQSFRKYEGWTSWGDACADWDANVNLKAYAVKSTQ